MATKKQAKKSSSNSSSIRAVLNVVLALLIGVGSWFAAPTVIASLRRNVPVYLQFGISGTTEQVIITVVLFLIGFMIASLLLLAVLPNDSRSTSDAAVAKHQAKQFEGQRKTRGGKTSNRKRT